MCDSSFLSILSGLCVFSEYSCVEPQKAAQKGITYMKRLITIILALIMTFFTAPQKGSDQLPANAVNPPQTAITLQVEQVPEDNKTTAETECVSEVSGTETAVETEETTATENEVVTKEAETFTEEKTPTKQENVTEECTEIIEEKVITEVEEETVEYIDEGNQSLAEYKPQIGGQPNPFDNDTPTDIDDRPVEDYINEGEDRPGEGKHF